MTDKRKAENNAWGRKVWLKEQKKKGNIKPIAVDASKMPVLKSSSAAVSPNHNFPDIDESGMPALETSSLFSEPEKIFESKVTRRRTASDEGGAKKMQVTLSVETPDGFPEGVESKEPAINIEIQRNKSAVVRFNRPRERNALAQEVLAAVKYILDEVIPQHNPRILVFTGTGDIFASGANLKEIFALDKNLARQFAWRGQDLMKKIAKAEPLTIAAINGACYGGALDLALACDKRIASPNAIFCHPGANLGIITGWGGTQRLPRLVGEAAAMEMFLTAKRVDAKEALRIGLIDAIVENPLRFALANYYKA